MLHVISYDVTDDRRRHRIFETLKDFGRQVQLSVFECELGEEGVKELSEKLGREIEEGEDSCRIYRLCGSCDKEVRILGKGERYKGRKVVIV
jgi:CRISPR-associated protein Cas2